MFSHRYSIFAKIILLPTGKYRGLHSKLLSVLKFLFIVWCNFNKRQYLYYPILLNQKSAKNMSTVNEEKTLEIQIFHPKTQLMLKNNSNKRDEDSIISEMMSSAQKFRELNRQRLFDEIEKFKNSENQMSLEKCLTERSIEKFKASKMETKTEYLTCLIENERKLRSLEKIALETAHFMKNLQPKFIMLNEQIQKMNVNEVFKESFVSIQNSSHVTNDSTQTDEINDDEKKNMNANPDADENKTENDDINKVKGSNKWNESSMEDDNIETSDDDVQIISDTELQCIKNCNICGATFDTFAMLFKHNARKHGKEKLSKKQKEKRVVKVTKRKLRSK